MQGFRNRSPPESHSIIPGRRVECATMPPPFEIIEHPADVGFVAYGGTLAELFANAALAMMSLACELDTIRQTLSRAIEVTAADLESLLFAWLAEILGTADGEQIAFCRAEVTALSSKRAAGTVYGERFDKTRHRAGTYIKAVTLHQLRVEKTAERWRAQVYLDV